MTHVPAACMEQGVLDPLCPSNVHHRHHTTETVVGERDEMTSCLQHTPVSRMSKDMVQPCRHLNKLAGLEGTFSTDIEAFRARQTHLLWFRKINTGAALGRGRAHAMVCTVPSLASDPMQPSESKQQLKKEDLSCSVCKAFSSAQ